MSVVRRAASKVLGGGESENGDLKSSVRIDLLADPDSSNLDNNQLPLIVVRGRVRLQIPLQAFDEVRCNLGMVQDLECNDAFEPGRRISNDVSEIAVERKQDRVEFLGFGNYH